MSGQKPKANNIEDGQVTFEGHALFTTAPVSERVKSLTPLDLLQIKYALVRDVIYNPEGWRTLDELEGEGLLSIEAEDRGCVWLGRLEGNQMVYKLIESDTTKYGFNDSSSVGSQLHMLQIHCKENPEIAYELAPKGFICTDGSLLRGNGMPAFE